MSEKPFRLGNVWVVGASSGLGRSFVHLIDGKADRIAISARSSHTLKEMQSQGDCLKAYPLDAVNEFAVARTAKSIESEFGGIDLAVLSAGLWKQMPISDMDVEHMRNAMDVNYFGVVNAVQALLPGMKARGRGHIVIVASVAGYRGLPSSVAYGPTKAALMNFAETLKIELCDSGIDISIVNPGFIDTPMVRGNSFNMPGLMNVDRAAQKMLDGILKKKYAILFPTVFANAVRMTNLLPNWLYFKLIRLITDR